MPSRGSSRGESGFRGIAVWAQSGPSLGPWPVARCMFLLPTCLTLDGHQGFHRGGISSYVGSLVV